MNLILNAILYFCIISFMNSLTLFDFDIFNNDFFSRQIETRKYLELGLKVNKKGFKLKRK